VGDQHRLSVISMIALVLLIGIVKKNAIMMIDFALVPQREHGWRRAMRREACIVRFRPIMMTTMVAILAALPLAIGLGDGSELRRPLGIAMIGGLLSRSPHLLSTPAIYVIFSCLQGRWHAGATAAASASLPGARPGRQRLDGQTRIAAPFSDPNGTAVPVPDDPLNEASCIRKQAHARAAWCLAAAAIARPSRGVAAARG
jgi:hypothetical protein